MDFKFWLLTYKGVNSMIGDYAELVAKDKDFPVTADEYKIMEYVHVKYSNSVSEFKAFHKMFSESSHGQEVEKWKEVGNMAKIVNNDLLDLIVKGREQGVTEKQLKPLIDALKKVDEFRNESDNFVIINGYGDTKTFYGNSSKVLGY